MQWPTLENASLPLIPKSYRRLPEKLLDSVKWGRNLANSSVSPCRKLQLESLWVGCFTFPLFWLLVILVGQRPVFFLLPFILFVLRCFTAVVRLVFPMELHIDLCLHFQFLFATRVLPIASRYTLCGPIRFHMVGYGINCNAKRHWLEKHCLTIQFFPPLLPGCSYSLEWFSVVKASSCQLKMFMLAAIKLTLPKVELWEDSVSRGLPGVPCHRLFFLP